MHENYGLNVMKGMFLALSSKLLHKHEGYVFGLRRKYNLWAIWYRIMVRAEYHWLVWRYNISVWFLHGDAILINFVSNDVFCINIFDTNNLSFEMIGKKHSL